MIIYVKTKQKNNAYLIGHTWVEEAWKKCWSAPVQSTAKVTNSDRTNPAKRSHVSPF